MGIAPSAECGLHVWTGANRFSKEVAQHPKNSAPTLRLGQTQAAGKGAVPHSPQFLSAISAEARRPAAVADLVDRELHFALNAMVILRRRYPLLVATFKEARGLEAAAQARKTTTRVSPDPPCCKLLRDCYAARPIEASDQGSSPRRMTSQASQRR
jgi:hypothetical protein